MRRKATDNYAEPVDAGIEIKYLTCPLCGFNQPLRKFIERSKKVRFGRIDPHEFQFYTIRKGGGWRSGFHRIDGKTLLEIKKDTSLKKMVEDIKKQCEKLLEILK